MSRFTISFDASTVTGENDKNQDVFLADGFMSSVTGKDSQQCIGTCDADEHLHVFSVCDGIGMFEDSGPVTQEVLHTVQEQANLFNRQSQTADGESVLQWCRDTLDLARRRMKEFCDENHVSGSCTLAMLVLTDTHYVAVNSGDSPVFSYKNGVLEELSYRHTMASFKRKLGLPAVDAEERMLLHHFGEETLTVAQVSGELVPDSVFFLCSDGVFNVFGKEGLEKHLQTGKTADYFTQTAGKTPQSDNCTAVCVHVIG